MKHMTVRQALQQVADYPQPLDDELVQWPAYELISRTLYEVANMPDQSVRGSMNRANRARKMILDRLVGRRRSGSHPATRNNVTIDFIDLTGGEIGAKPPDDAQPADGGREADRSTEQQP
jgi:hypothetical protein